jgi:hypothetical protein
VEETEIGEWNVVRRRFKEEKKKGKIKPFNPLSTKEELMPTTKKSTAKKTTKKTAKKAAKKPAKKKC